MIKCTRIYTDEQGLARFEDIQIPMEPEEPGPNMLSISEPFATSTLLFVRAVAGGGHANQPEPHRQLGIVLAGSSEITATGETRTFSTGDVMLIEDTAGTGHSSTTEDGLLAALVVLDTA